MKKNLLLILLALLTVRPAVSQDLFTIGELIEIAGTSDPEALNSLMKHRNFSFLRHTTNAKGDTNLLYTRRQPEGPAEWVTVMPMKGFEGNAVVLNTGAGDFPDHILTEIANEDFKLIKTADNGDEDYVKVIGDKEWNLTVRAPAQESNAAVYIAYLFATPHKETDETKGSGEVLPAAFGAHEEAPSELEEPDGEAATGKQQRSGTQAESRRQPVKTRRESGRLPGNALAARPLLSFSIGADGLYMLGNANWVSEDERTGFRQGIGGSVVLDYHPLSFLALSLRGGYYNWQVDRDYVENGAVQFSSISKFTLIPVHLGLKLYPYKGVYVMPEAGYDLYTFDYDDGTTQSEVIKGGNIGYGGSVGVEVRSKSLLLDIALRYQLLAVEDLGNGFTQIGPASYAGVRVGVGFIKRK